VDRKFQTPYGGIRVLLNDTGIDGKFRKGVWSECASTAIFYESIIINREKKLPVNLMVESSFKELQRFGEMCVVTTKEKIQLKVSDRGTICFFWLSFKSSQ
jgi:hypothetical protein